MGDSRVNDRGRESVLFVEKKRFSFGLRLTIAGVVLAGLIPRVYAQTPVPASLSNKPGVHIKSYDGKSHHSQDYYSALRNVVLKEFDIPSDSSAINLVFITEDLRESLNSSNPARFGAADWTGAFLTPSLIFIVGTEESDDTFMHEYMHSLQVRGLIFSDVPHSVVHEVITQDEGLLLGSASYLEFLKTRHP
ncbi:MAG: hypothetical protein WB699_13085 [Bacteroidota bacterium]